METPLHTEKCTAWCALPKGGIVGPIFFDDTVTADHYLHVHQDGAWPYTVNAVLDVLNEHSGECCLLIFLSGPDVGGPGHHTFQILTHVIIS
jgi:hypothetical protein